MMLSVCIPVYNFDVTELITDIRNQINTDDLDAEIIFIDDASQEEMRQRNEIVKSLTDHYILLEKNIGRSKIRNLFLKYSKSDYLLFLDCDGKIITKGFIKNYINFINDHHPDVVYGGRTVNESKPDLRYGLRWKFAIERENLPVDVRKKSPYRDFQTNNFIVRKSVLENHPFDESIVQYGYEDLIFAKNLYKDKIKIEHIDNAIYNNDVETNEVFLKKADQSAKSLAHLIETDLDVRNSSNIKLAKAYALLKKTGGILIYKMFYKIMKPFIIRKLLSGKAELKTLDLYKLGQLIDHISKS